MTTPTNNGHQRLLRALAAVESQFREALGRRKAIRATAGTMHDEWGEKVRDPHDPDLKHHLLERRHAALLAGGTDE